jgi:BMFP domain-containing protein YqiC
VHPTKRAPKQRIALKVDAAMPLRYALRMLDKIHLEELSRRLSEAVPSGLTGLRADLEKTFRGILQGAFEKMNLVSREEFDVQRAVLARTRAKLEQLEARVAELEQRQSDQ